MTHHVKPAEFVKRLDVSRQTFYDCLKKMKAVGAAEPDCRTIDMDSPWMQNWSAANGTGQRRAKPDSKPAPARPPIRRQPAQSEDVEPDELPDIARLVHIEQFEKVRKMQIGNEEKLKNLFARPLVKFLVEHIEDFFIKLIIDGESSLVPKLFDKARAPNGTLEDCKKIYRQEITKRIKGVKSKMVTTYKEMKK